MKIELKERINIIDESLNRFLPVRDNAQALIYEAMRYSLFAGGKRLRPILMWETAKLFGGDWNTVERFACALEMIHTYSLIHDDLPAMDNDDLRRGMPTNHIKFGEAEAILAGDALLNKAFEVVSAGEYDDPKRAMRAVSILAESSGTEGMIGGQILDLAAEGKKVALDELRNIHLLKTGAIIRSACLVGAVLMGAQDNLLDAVDTFAKNLGVAFQIRDDILDVTGTAEELGKPIGSDADCDKNTYVSICGLERSKELVAEFSSGAKEALSVFGQKAEFLLRLTDYLVDRNY